MRENARDTSGNSIKDGFYWVKYNRGPNARKESLGYASADVMYDPSQPNAISRALLIISGPDVEYRKATLEEVREHVQGLRNQVSFFEEQMKRAGSLDEVIIPQNLPTQSSQHSHIPEAHTSLPEEIREQIEQVR